VFTLPRPAAVLAAPLGLRAAHFRHARASPRALDRAKIFRPRAPPQPTGPLRTHPRPQIPSRSVALRNTAQFAAALTSATEAVDGSRALGDPSLLAESLLEQGWNLEESGDQAASRAAINSAFFKATEAGNDTVAAKCTLQLITLHLGSEPARQWIPHAEAIIARISQKNSALAHRLEAELSISLGTVAVTDEKYAEAEEHYRKALDIFGSLTPLDELGEGSAHNNLGNLLLRRGDIEGARGQIETSLQIYRRQFGSHHPSVGVALNNLGDIYMRDGRFTSAEEVFTQAFAIFTASLDPKHPNIGVIHNNLGDVFQQTGRLIAAKEHYETSVHIFESAFGDEAGLLGYPLTGLGEVLFLQGEEPAATAILEKAMALPNIGDAWLRGRTRFALAQALAGKPAARARVTELAEASREAFVSAGPSYARELATVERWLETRRGRRK
jgi:tetratricopeptide (TPR) repeat protein